MAIRFPFHLHRQGPDTAADDEYVIRDLIEQVLLTTAGERVNRPDFGRGLLQLTFGTLSDVLETALQTSIAGTLQQWIGDLVQVQDVQVHSGLELGEIASSPESTLLVTVSYVDLWTQRQHRVEVQVPR